MGYLTDGDIFLLVPKKIYIELGQKEIFWLH